MPLRDAVAMPEVQVSHPCPRRPTLGTYDASFILILISMTTLCRRFYCLHFADKAIDFQEK